MRNQLKLCEMAMSSSRPSLPDVGETPNQPLHYDFPKLKYGKTKIVVRFSDCDLISSPLQLKLRNF